MVRDIEVIGYVNLLNFSPLAALEFPDLEAILSLDGESLDPRRRIPI